MGHRNILERPRPLHHATILVGQSDIKLSWPVRFMPCVRHSQRGNEKFGWVIAKPAEEGLPRRVPPPVEPLQYDFRAFGHSEQGGDSRRVLAPSSFQPSSRIAAGFESVSAALAAQTVIQNGSLVR